MFELVDPFHIPSHWSSEEGASPWKGQVILVTISDVLSERRFICNRQ